MDNLKTFTVFVVNDGLPTSTWIDKVQAVDKEAAADIAVLACHDDWYTDHTDDPEVARQRVRVLGIAEGDVKILYWEDPE